MSTTIELVDTKSERDPKVESRKDQVDIRYEKGVVVHEAQPWFCLQ